MDEKDRLIEAILEIELRMFLTVNPVLTSACQEDPKGFRLHRRAQFLPWAEETLASYLEDLRAADGRGENLMRRKYALLQGPRAESGPDLEEIVRLEMEWQRAMFRDYPALMGGARPLTDDRTRAEMTSFETYTRGELETYSPRTLGLLRRDLAAMRARGESLSEKIYDRLVRALGYASLADAEQKLQARINPRADGPHVVSPGQPK